MNALAVAAVNAGLIDKVLLEEFRRWKAPIEIPDTLPEPPTTVEEAAAAIEEVLQSESFVLTRETDLEIFRQYMKTQTVGNLHVEIPADPEAPLGLEVTTADFQVTFGKTAIGEFIIPWRSESIRQEMTNGMTYLLVEDPPSALMNKIFFKDTREVYYGDTKAFMVCSPSMVEVMPELKSIQEAPSV